MQIVSFSTDRTAVVYILSIVLYCNIVLYRA